MMEIGRFICAQELNITRIVASQRNTALLNAFIGKKMIDRTTKRRIPSKRSLRSKY